MNYQGRPSINFSLEWTGFNGRCNKIADTCYAFWVHGSLSVSLLSLTFAVEHTWTNTTSNRSSINQTSPTQNPSVDGSSNEPSILNSAALAKSLAICLIYIIPISVLLR
jgi:prenyltransferase beta subunit